MPLRGVNSGPLPRFACSFVPQRGEEAEHAAPDRKLAIARLVIPAGLAISCAAHFAFLTPLVIFGAKSFDIAPPGSIAVDIVSAEELAQASGQDREQEAAQDTKQEPSPEQTKPTFDVSTPFAPTLAAASAGAPPQSQPQSPPAERAIPFVPPGRAQQSGAAALPPADRSDPLSTWLPPPSFAPVAPEQPEQAPPQESDATSMFAMPLTLPDGQVGGKFDAAAVDRADVADDVVAAFRSHLKACSLPPAGIPAEVKVVVRVYLKPDGSLVTGLPQNPELIKVGTGGGALLQAAVAALRRCQPYSMLPPDRYDEWKRLDITFTPENF